MTRLAGAMHTPAHAAGDRRWGRGGGICVLKATLSYYRGFKLLPGVKPQETTGQTSHPVCMIELRVANHAQAQEHNSREQQPA